MIGLATLFGLYALLLLDLFLGQPVGAFAWGNPLEYSPLWFTLGVVFVTARLWRLEQRGLAIIGLVFCAYWLIFDSRSNGWNAVLAPSLITALILFITLKLFKKFKQ